jgi:hypothetical protein
MEAERLKVGKRSRRGAEIDNVRQTAWWFMRKE